MIAPSCSHGADPEIRKWVSSLGRIKYRRRSRRRRPRERGTCGRRQMLSPPGGGPLLAPRRGERNGVEELLEREGAARPRRRVLLEALKDEGIELGGNGNLGALRERLRLL